VRDGKTMGREGGVGLLYEVYDAPGGQKMGLSGEITFCPNVSVSSGKREER